MLCVKAPIKERQWISQVVWRIAVQRHSAAQSNWKNSKKTARISSNGKTYYIKVQGQTSR